MSDLKVPPEDADREDPRSEVLKACEPMIRQEARRIAVRANWFDFDDLCQEGRMAVLAALPRYDCARPLVPFMRPCARHAMLRAAERTLSRTMAEQRRRISVVERELAQRLGRMPTDEEIAKAAYLKLEQLHRVYRAEALLMAVEIDAILDGPLDPRAVADDCDAQAARRELLQQAMETLTDVERWLLSQVGLRKMSHEEAARILRLQPTYTRVMLSNIYKKLRNAIKR